MQVTLSLPDKIASQLARQPDPDQFVATLLEAALQPRKPPARRPLGALKGHLQVAFSDDFKMTDEELLRS
jgi:hypothetical protein